MTELSSDAVWFGVMRVRFWDSSWADTGYRFYALACPSWFCVPTGQTWLHTEHVGRKGYQNTTYYNRGPDWPPGYYHVCGYTWNAIHGDQHSVCAPSFTYI